MIWEIEDINSLEEIEITEANGFFVNDNLFYILEDILNFEN